MRQPPPNNGAGNSLAHVNSISRQHKTRKFDNEQIPSQSSKKGGPNAVHENGIDFDAIRAAHPLVSFLQSRGFEVRRSGSSGLYVCVCPFHEEKTPSFTIYPDHHAWCYGCRRRFDVVNLELALGGGSLQDAIARLSGASVANGSSGPRADILRLTPTASELEKSILLPDLEKPTEQDLRILSARRSIDIIPLTIAVDRGFLWCFDDWRNGRCWIYTDETRRCAIRRRLDNKLFRLANGHETKAAACPGSDMRSPLGTHESQFYPCISIQEGSTDSLAAIAHAWASGVVEWVAPICMPSISANFTNATLAYMQGKRGRVFIDNDRPGMEAANRWAAQLQTANVVIDGFSFDGLIQNDGSAVKDLNDLLKVDADCWEANREVIESVMSFAFEGRAPWRG